MKAWPCGRRGGASALHVAVLQRWRRAYLAGLRHARAWLDPAILAAFLALVGHVRAQDLAVVETSPQDQQSAEKLAELVREPFLRVAPPVVDMPPAAATSCRTHARLELVLDSAGRSVRLIRCRDGTVLSRALAADASKQSSYLGAFVAAELLAINRELEAVEARARRAPVEPATSGPGAAPAPAPAAAVGGGSSRSALRLRAGSELSLWGRPLARVLRASAAAAVSLPPLGGAVRVWLELYFGLFAAARLMRGAEQLQLQRHDGQLRLGVQHPLGPLRLSGFVLLRVALTSARYRSDMPSSTTQLRTGLGAGLEAELPLGQTFALYLQGALDVATSRSDYRVAGVSWVRDPASLFWLGLGLSAELGP